MTEGVFRVYLTEAQHAVILEALEAYHDDIIQESPGAERGRLVDGAMNALIVGQFEPV